MLSPFLNIGALLADKGYKTAFTRTIDANGCQYNYYGIAESGSKTSDPAWTIMREAINADGTVGTSEWVLGEGLYKKDCVWNTQGKDGIEAVYDGTYTF
jgi:hypothetical protein